MLAGAQMYFVFETQSISTTFYTQLLRQQSCASRVKKKAACASMYVKAARRTLVKLTPRLWQMPYVTCMPLPAISFNSRRLGPIPRGRLSAVGVEVRDLEGRRAGVQGSAPT
jgi:hypothetical protein